MCGIAGFNWQDKSIIEEMAQTMRHRGPDDEGFYTDGGVSLGHRRLSIIDTSEKGRQKCNAFSAASREQSEKFSWKSVSEQLFYYYNKVLMNSSVK
jgi:asparagine synthetase B (glutamine-hydrolysing)